MLSVIIICKNEEKTIARCLQSVKWAKQIIVVDSGSIDKTVEIAQAMGAEVKCTDWPGFGPQKQRALNLATQDWVLSLDADEYLSESAQNDIEKAIKNPKIDAYILPIRMIFQNKILKKAGLSRHLRLFRRQKARFSDDLVHEKVMLPPNAIIHQLSATILHESYQNWSDAIAKMNNYSSLSAKTRNRPSKFYQALIASSWMLIRNLFLKGWILDADIGIALAVYQAQGSWYRYLKQLHPD
jgi:glycosyltransferase involved in cell wall biosynthesis